MSAVKTKERIGKGTIRLCDIVIDPTLQVREVNTQIVNEYRQQLRAGAKFPRIEVENKGNRLTKGFHRYYMYKAEWEPNSNVDVTYAEYKDDHAIIQEAIRDNVSHGWRMSTWDKKVAAMRLKEMGDKPEKIAEIMKVSPERVKEWMGMTVIVVGGDNTTTHRPLKHGFEHMAGESMSEESYSLLKNTERGIPLGVYVDEINRWLTNNWVDLTDAKLMVKLAELKTNLDKCL